MGGSLQRVSDAKGGYSSVCYWAAYSSNASAERHTISALVGLKVHAVLKPDVCCAMACWFLNQPKAPEGSHVSELCGGRGSDQLSTPNVGHLVFLPMELLPLFFVIQHSQSPLHPNTC